MSLILTLIHTGEHIYLGNIEDLVYCRYFFKLDTKFPGIPSYFDYIASISCLTSNMIEFLFFIIIISELYRLHQIRVRHRPNAARRHAKKNAITAMGHFVSWIVEMLVFGLVSLVVFSRNLIDLHQGEEDLSLWMFMMLIPSINYAIFPAIQVLTSPELRQHMFCQNSCGRQRRGADVEEIELNVIANGDIAHA